MPSIYDISKRAGVSGVTVSKVLSGKSRPTRRDAVARAEKIRKIARELGYRANTAARAARSGRFQRVGLILPHGHASYIPHGFVSALTHALNDHDHQLAIAELPQSGATDDALPCMLSELSVDGLLSLAPSLLASQRAGLGRFDLPAIAVNDKRPAGAVYPDELGGGRRLTNYLLGLGHRRITLVDFDRQWERRFELADVPDEPDALPPYRACAEPRDLAAAGGRRHFSGPDRRAGYEQAMRDAGLVPDYRALVTHDTEDEIEQVAGLLSGEDRPTALAVVGESNLPAVFQAAARAGLTVPRDLSVTSFSWGGPWRASVGLTCMRYDGADLAKLAARTILEQIENPDSDTPAATFTGRLVIDRTVAAPREGG